jgi:hypothetical protein
MGFSPEKRYIFYFLRNQISHEINVVRFLPSYIAPTFLENLSGMLFYHPLLRGESRRSLQEGYSLARRESARVRSMIKKSLLANYQLSIFNFPLFFFPPHVFIRGIPLPSCLSKTSPSESWHTVLLGSAFVPRWRGWLRSRRGWLLYHCTFRKSEVRTMIKKSLLANYQLSIFNFPLFFFPPHVFIRGIPLPSCLSKASPWESWHIVPVRSAFVPRWRGWLRSRRGWFLSSWSKILLTCHTRANGLQSSLSVAR